MSTRKWYDLEGQTEDAVFGGEKSAFSSLGLTRSQRLAGFGICFVAGFGISLLGGILLVIGATGAFATLFGVGAIVSLIGTGFLVCVSSSYFVLVLNPWQVPTNMTWLNPRSGFKKQATAMFKPVRVVATIILFAAIIMTFVSAFLLPSILCILFVVIQYLAFLWYCLSYIPYARTVVKSWMPW